jgi:hypothetical protein
VKGSGVKQVTQVTLGEAQAHLADLITRVIQGEDVVIKVGDEQIQLVRLPVEYMIEMYGVTIWLGRGQRGEEEADAIRTPYVTSGPPQKEGPIEPGSAEGMFWMSDDFDEPLEEFEEYME